MNKWTKISFKKASEKGYLDRLIDIYPVGIELERVVSANLINEIKDAYEKKDNAILIDSLLKLEKFPINDPYVASIKQHRELIDKNPITIKRICEKIFNLELDKLIVLLSVPKSPSRQFGPSFRNWLHKLEFPFLDEENFRKEKLGFLIGDDSKLGKYAAEELKIDNLNKGLDFILKINQNYFIGEAKFISDNGGTQLGQFRSAMTIAKINKHDVKGMVVVDGIPWFTSRNEMHMSILSTNELVMSAEVFKDFITENLTY